MRGVENLSGKSKNDADHGSATVELLREQSEALRNLGSLVVDGHGWGSGDPCGPRGWSRKCGRATSERGNGDGGHGCGYNDSAGDEGGGRHDR
jgi:hypothetical protein